MLSKTLAAVCLLGLTSSPLMAANFMLINIPPSTEVLSGPTTVVAPFGGTIILNLQNGNLTGCPNGSSAITGSNLSIPLGKCGQIGVMDITGVNGLPENIQFSQTGGFALITNAITGFTAICTAITNLVPPPPSIPTDASFGGSCIARRAL